MKTIQEALLKTKEIEYSENKRYEYFLINTFIQENFKDITKEEFFEIKKNQIICNFLIKKNEHELQTSIFDKCIDYEISFPHKFKSGFLKKMPMPKVQKYLSILEKEGKREQLEKYYNEYDKYFELYFSNKNNPSNIIGEIVLSKKPESLLNYIGSWSNNKICEWLDQNKQHIKDIIQKSFIPRPCKEEQIQNKIYSILLENKESLNSDKGYLSHLFFNLPTSFYSYLSKYEKSFLNEFLSNEFQIHSSLIENQFSKNKDSYNLNLNGLQMILYKRGPSELSFSNVLKDNVDLILKPIVIDAKFYDREENFLEFALSNKAYGVFPLLNVNEVGKKEQQIIVSTAFNIIYCIDHSEDSNSNIQKLIDWASKTLTEAPNYCFDKCMNKYISSHKKSPDIDSIKLYRDLQNSLPNNLKESNKMKV